jgi:hypothetical protein
MVKVKSVSEDKAMKMSLTLQAAEVGIREQDLQKETKC